MYLSFYLQLKMITILQRSQRLVSVLLTTAHPKKNILVKLYFCWNVDTRLLHQKKHFISTGHHLSEMSRYQTWGDYSTNVIDYDYLPPAWLRIIKITM